MRDKTRKKIKSGKIIAHFSMLNNYIIFKLVASRRSANLPMKFAQNCVQRFSFKVVPTWKVHIYVIK